MKLNIFTEILTKHIGARQDGSQYVLPADVELTILVALEGETLTVSRIHRLDLEAGGAESIVVVDDSRGERYVFAVEDVRVLKLDRREAARRERGAGFGK